MPTELEMLLQDRRLALINIEEIEAYYKEQLTYAKEDLKIADEGIAKEMAKLLK